MRNIYAIQKKCAAAVTVFNTYTAIVPIVSGLLNYSLPRKTNGIHNHVIYDMDINSGSV